jgi:hypothetical protein
LKFENCNEEEGSRRALTTAKIAVGRNGETPAAAAFGGRGEKRGSCEKEAKEGTEERWRTRGGERGKWVAVVEQPPLASRGRQSTGWTKGKEAQQPKQCKCGDGDLCGIPLPRYRRFVP